MAQPVRADVLPVTFTAARGGTSPATYTQINVLDWVRRGEEGGVDTSIVELPTGARLDDVGQALAVLLARHESLRTVYPPVDGDGEPVQSVLTRGVLDARLVPLRSGTPPADQLARIRADGPFDPATELPIRVTIGVRDGRPLLVRLDISHTAVDLTAVAIVRRDFAELVRPGATRTVGAAGRQPADQARDERSGPAARRMAATLRYWAAHLARWPLCLLSLPAGPTPTGASHRTVTLTSPAAAPALAAVAERTTTSRSTVLLAAVTAVLTWWLDQPAVTVYSTCGNRFLPEMREYVGTIAQEALIPVTAAGSSFDAMVRELRSVVVNAYRHGFYDSRELSRQIEALAVARGMPRHRDLIVNDVSALAPPPDNDVSALAPPPDPAAPPSAGAERRPCPVAGAAVTVEHSRVTTTETIGATDPLRVTVHRMVPELVVALTGHARLLPPDTMERLLRGVERLLLAAAAGDLDLADVGAVTGVSRVRRGPEWLRVDGCWVDLDRTQRILAQTLGGGAVRVVPEPPPRPDGAGDHGLVAYLAPPGPELDLGALHAAYLARIRHEHGVLAPHRYVVVDRAPDDVRDPARWQARPARAAGSGRPAEAPAGTVPPTIR